MENALMQQPSHIYISTICRYIHLAPRVDPVPLAAVDPADVAPAPLPDGGHAWDPARVSAHLGVSVSIISSVVSIDQYCCQYQY